MADDQGNVVTTSTYAYEDGTKMLSASIRTYDQAVLDLVLSLAAGIPFH